MYTGTIFSIQYTWNLRNILWKHMTYVETKNNFPWPLAVRSWGMAWNGMAGFSPESCPRDFDGVHVAYTVPLETEKLWNVIRSHWEITWYNLWKVRVTSKHLKTVSFCCFGDFVDCPKFKKRSVEACWVICCSSNKANRAQVASATKVFFSGHVSAFLKLRSRRSVSALYIFLLYNQKYNNMWIHYSFDSHDSYAFLWPLLNLITQ